MIRRVLVVLAVVLAGALVGVAPAGAVTGGTTVSGGSWGFLAKVNVGIAHACTGALVAPQWVLTASSCFAVDGQPVTSGVPASAATVTVGRTDLSRSDGRVLPVLRIVPHATRDVLLVKLGLRVTDVAPVPVGGTAPAAGEAVQIAGFGRTASEWVPDLLRAAPALVGAVAEDSYDWTGPAGSEVAACQGDAGGPVVRGSGSQAQLVGVNTAAGQGGCLGAAEGGPFGGTATRVDGLSDWISGNATEPTTAFQAYHNTATGMGGFDLRDGRDQVLAFDYAGSGKLDHLVFYRPGGQKIWIVKHNADDTYTQVFSSSSGIGGYDLKDARDRIVAYDYSHSGKLDHLLIYRPGMRTAFILGHGAGNTFAPVYSTTVAGIGGHDLADPRDKVIAYDYEHSGKLDHLLIYRPGTGSVQILKHGTGNTFTAVFKSGTGIGGYDLVNGRDQVLAYDYEHTGKLDHLVLYRPGDRTAFVVKHNPDHTFSAVFSNTRTGMGGYDLADTRDQVIAYDYERTGRPDHLMLYRPGEGTVQILKHGAGTSFSPVFVSGTGIGGYTLESDRDRIVAFDDEHAGSPTHLVLYRPMDGILWVVGRSEPAGSAPVTVRPVLAEDSTVERFAYPGAAEILESLNVRLISGDGHILMADCATTPVNDIGVVRVRTTEQIGPNGAGLVCFKVSGPVGRLDLEVPGVYEIRGDGQKANAGHPLTAVVTTEDGPPQSVVVDPSGSTQVGIGIDPNNDPTRLLQLRVPS
jgi:hypothetical protein